MKRITKGKFRIVDVMIESNTEIFIYEKTSCVHDGYKRRTWTADAVRVTQNELIAICKELGLNVAEGQ